MPCVVPLLRLRGSMRAMAFADAERDPDDAVAVDRDVAGAEDRPAAAVAGSGGSACR